MFSTGFFHHLWDGSHDRHGVEESHSMQGIALGRCCSSDGMIFYSPHTKELYTSSDYKLDEGRSTPPTTFNLRYDGGLFVGLYNSSSINSSIEPHPEGTSVSFPLKESGNSLGTVLRRGTVIPVPIPSPDSPLPLSVADAMPYVIHLVDGSVHKVTPDFVSTIVTTTSLDTNKIFFPSWLGNLQKGMYLYDGVYRKGVVEWTWMGTTGISPNAAGMALNSLVSPFPISANLFRNTSMMVLWSRVGTGEQNFQAGSTYHVSAYNLHIPFPQIPSYRLLIKETLTSRHGLHCISMNMRVFVPMTLLTLLVRSNNLGFVDNTTSMPCHPCPPSL